MEDFINKLKEEIAKEPVWASLSVIEIIDKLAEEMPIIMVKDHGRKQALEMVDVYRTLKDDRSSK